MHTVQIHTGCEFLLLHGDSKHNHHLMLDWEQMRIKYKLSSDQNPRYIANLLGLSPHLMVTLLVSEYVLEVKNHSLTSQADDAVLVTSAEAVTEYLHVASSCSFLGFLTAW